MSISIKENMLKVYRHEEPDFLPLLSDMQVIGDADPGIVAKVIERRPTEKHEIDWFGQWWTFEPTVNAFNPDATRYAIKDIENWRDYVHIPDLDAIDWDEKFRLDNVQVNRDKLVVINSSYGIWERMFSTVPIADLLCALIEEPEACADYIHEITDFKIKLNSIYMEYYKPDVLRLHDDYGNGGGLFMSPATWRSLFKDELQRIIDNVRDHGVMYEHHCCGYMYSLAGEIRDMGATSWQSVHVCNDTDKTVETYSGNLSLIQVALGTQYLDGPGLTEEDVRAHVRDAARKYYPGKGLFLDVNLKAHPERKKIVTDELLRNQDLFKEQRPE